MKRKNVSIVMGSDTDLPIMEQASEILEKFEIGYEIDIVAAHRTPEKLYKFTSNAHHRRIVVIFAETGGAARLSGIVVAFSPLPIIGVRAKSTLKYIYHYRKCNVHTDKGFSYEMRAENPQFCN